MPRDPKRHATHPCLRLRVVLDAKTAFGPGKADLLEGVAQTGSISAAARRMQMSYKRAWDLIAGMNESFERALVRTRRGGKDAGGAELTETGQRVLSLYRQIESQCARASRTTMTALADLKRSETRRSRS